MSTTLILAIVCLILFFLCVGLFSMWRDAESRAENYLRNLQDYYKRLK